jgi:hypothetical protein
MEPRERRRKRRYKTHRLCHHATELSSFPPCFRSHALILMWHPKGLIPQGLTLPFFPSLLIARYSAKLASNWDLAFGKKNKDKN